MSMSQRNWKTAQRKARNFQPNFGARTAATLNSIQESSVSTNSRSSAPGADKSSMASAAESKSKEEATAMADVFQIIEEECLKNQGSEGTAGAPPMSTLQQGQNVNNNDQIHYVSTDEDFSNTNTDGKGDEEDDAPVIYTNHDDDSISQITSSIAGNSLYSHDYVFSRLSYPKKKHFIEQHQHLTAKQNTSIHSDRNEQKSNFDSSKCSDPNVPALDGSSGSSEKGKHSPLLDDEELDKFFGSNADEEVETKDILVNVAVDCGTVSSSKRLDKAIDVALGHLEKDEDGLIDNVVNIYTNEGTEKGRLQTHGHGNDTADDLTMRDMYSLDPSARASVHGRYASPREGGLLQNILHEGQYKVSSAYMKTKHFLHSRLASYQSNSLQKKDDDHDANSISGETDYFGILMSNSFVSTLPHSSPYSSQQEKKDKQINALWVSFLLVLVWLLMYLAKVGNDTALERNKKFSLDKKNPFPHALDQRPPLPPVLNQANLLPPTGAIKGVRGVGGGIIQTLDRNAMPQSVDPSMKNGPPAVQTNPMQAGMANADPPAESRPLAIQTDLSHVGMALPETFNNFIDIDVKSYNHLPFFWHVPRSAGATVNNILGACYHLKVASNAGGPGHEQEEALRVIDDGIGHSYVNVDVSRSEGIQRAVRLGLGSSGLAEVAVSSLLHESAALFDPTNRGRMFTLLRHPVERASSLFYFLQDVQWRQPNTFNQELANMNIADFYKNRLGESNWQVRFLTNQLTKAFVDENDLKLAKEILRRKCLVGLTSEKAESFERFRKFFGWQLKKEKDSECLDNKLQWDWSLKHSHQEVEEGTELWSLIASHNKYDMELYEYARFLFSEQSNLFQ